LADSTKAKEQRSRDVFLLKYVGICQRHRFAPEKSKAFHNLRAKRAYTCNQNVAEHESTLQQILPRSEEILSFLSIKAIFSFELVRAVISEQNTR